MRQEEQQGSTDHPEAVRSAPVPVPPPDAATRTSRDDRDGRADIPDDVLDDRGPGRDRPDGGARVTTIPVATSEEGRGVVGRVG
ncbi:hypothetical protein AB0F73_20090, partial [Micromonospora purpureochromogenes]